MLAIDLGSSQLKLLVMDENARVRAVVTEGYPTLTPGPGYLVQRPEDWRKALERGFARLSEMVELAEIEVVSFSGHMSGLVMVDGEGEVLYPCVMLSDCRSGEECRILEKCVGDEIRRMSGNPVIDAFSLPKLLWMKRNEGEIYRRSRWWVSPKDCVRFWFTGKMETEYTDAYNSLCVDRRTVGGCCEKEDETGGGDGWKACAEAGQKAGAGGWSEEMIRQAGLDVEKFSEMHGPVEIAGKVTDEAAASFGLKAGTPVVYGGADMACGAVGNGLFEMGDTTLTLGTCATFLSMVEKEQAEAFGKVTFHMHVLPGRVYALGSHFNGGLAVNWFSKAFSRDGQVDYELVREMAGEAAKVAPGCDGVMTVPFLAGSGSPYFDSRDRQSVIGIDASVGRGKLFRSQLEGVAFNLRQTLEVFGRMQQGNEKPIVLGGGGVRVSVWPQMIADVFGKPLLLAENPDASAVGAALIGGAGVGIFDDLKKASRMALRISEQVEPVEENVAVYEECYRRFLKVYEVLGELKRL